MSSVGAAIDEAVNTSETHAETAAAHADIARTAAIKAVQATATEAAATVPVLASELGVHLEHRERIASLERETEWLKSQLAETTQAMSLLTTQLTPPVLSEAEMEAETEAETEAEMESDLLPEAEQEVGRKESPAVPVELPEAVVEIAEAPAEVVQKARRGFRLI